MQNKPKSYSQNFEDLIILEHLNGFVGTVVEFGANNGTDLSNSLLLIEKGFSAILIEPSIQFETLQEVHKYNLNVKCYNVAIGKQIGKVVFYESGCHIPGGYDYGLVSTLDKNELKRWPNVHFVEKKVTMIDIPTLRKDNSGNWDVISIDVEGHEMEILTQINLTEVGCKVICLEWNSKPAIARQFTAYCGKFGMKEIHRNSENLIFSL